MNIEAPYLDGKGELATPTVLAQIDARAKAATAPLLAGKRGVEATELGTEHLDTVTTPGTYTQSANLEATLEAGYPATRGGVLQVERSVSKTMVWQTYTTYAPSPSTPAQTWQRGSYNGTWTPWAKAGGGSGIEQVSGTVTLDASGDPIREFFTTGATTFKANGADTLLSSFTAVVWRRNSQGSWGYQVVQDGWTTPTPTPDTTAPVAGTLAVSTTDVKADLSVSGASDDRGYVQFSFSKDNGATWTAYQDAATHTFMGLTPSTAYQFRHRVKDSAGNVATGTAVSKTTVAAPPGWRTVRLYDFTGVADGTAANGLAPTVGTGALTAGSAVTVVGQALDVYPNGNVQSWSTPELTFTAPRFRSSMSVVAPADSVAGTAGDVVFVVSGGTSPSKGAGNYVINVRFNTPTANATTLALAPYSTYDGAPVVTMQGGKSQTGFPRTGTFTLDRVSDRELQVFVDGTLWATVTPAEPAATFGQKAYMGSNPANKYQGAHWKFDDIKQEVYA